MSEELKRQLLDQIADHLRIELDTVRRSVESARDAATHPDSKPENKYDTRGLEASYLAGAQKARADELEAKLLNLASVQGRIFLADEVIAAMALVTLNEQGKETRVFLFNLGAGYDLNITGKRVKCISLQSQLGQAMLGKKCGDFITIGTGANEKEFEITEVI